MAKLYFRYGAMGASKTANAIMVAYNYKERGLAALMLKPAIENRDGDKIIKSRIGLSWECEYIEDMILPDDIDSTTLRLSNWMKRHSTSKRYLPDAIIIDEVQFTDPETIVMLQRLVTEYDIPIICYGLREDFQQDPFPASAELCARADVIEELKTVCWCGQGAKCNARVIDGKVVKTGPKILLGANESYTSLCRKHWLEGNLGPNSMKR